MEVGFLNREVIHSKFFVYCLKLGLMRYKYRHCLKLGFFWFVLFLVGSLSGE